MVPYVVGLVVAVTDACAIVCVGCEYADKVP